MKTYKFECKYCERPVEVQGEAKHTAGLHLAQTDEWRNYRGKGWICPECRAQYDLTLRMLWANRFLHMTNDEAAARADKSMIESTVRYDERRDTTVEGKDDHFTLDDLYNLEEEAP